MFSEQQIHRGGKGGEGTEGQHDFAFWSQPEADGWERSAGAGVRGSLSEA